ncbi:hypothetical protein P5F04_07335 [Clostridium perfringens]|uniref:Uncharacterized protein n=1 Tax=Clostridium perfringens TaxID=1502 RepID=A0A8H9UWV7_CLOPF|nr:hypothetical protein [Clostridium perfringens]ELC8414781.1 hypothetical protein [Clostridium perfringens]MCH1962388.1 hypothetical protein [Clostridium perfringens]MDK0626725.1 hypothetical protein [Clostridium perfringens]MDK0734400.1 hypothetical protein [Clostridium perfringens]MDK0978791.1 hypothetical protein [Clostridium perfringens]
MHNIAKNIGKKVLNLKHTINKHNIRIMKFKKVENNIFLYFSSFKFVYRIPLNLISVSPLKNEQIGLTIPVISIVKSIIKEIQ